MVGGELTMWTLFVAAAFAVDCPAGTTEVVGETPVIGCPWAQVDVSPPWAPDLSGARPDAPWGPPVPARWCARPDGTRHGPAQYILGPDDTLTLAYRDGMPDGEVVRTAAGRRTWTWSQRGRAIALTADETMLGRWSMRGERLHGRFTVSGVRGRFYEGEPDGVWRADGPARFTFDGGQLNGPAVGQVDGVQAVGSFVRGKAHGEWTLLGPRGEDLGRTTLAHGSGQVPVRTWAGSPHGVRYVSEVVDGVVIRQSVDLQDEAALPNVEGTPEQLTLAGAVLGTVTVSDRSWCSNDAGYRLTLTPAGGDVPLVVGRPTPEGTCMEPAAECSAMHVNALSTAFHGRFGVGIGTCDGPVDGAAGTHLSVHDWGDLDTAIRDAAAFLEHHRIRDPIEVRIGPPMRVIQL
ncbi:MAG: hypothetical protein ACI9K2_003771 [Myxococcota bacterium]|jgi:hypothetical protein